MRVKEWMRVFDLFILRNAANTGAVPVCQNKF